jgi:hypothetical protein
VKRPLTAAALALSMGLSVAAANATGRSIAAVDAKTNPAELVTKAFQVTENVAPTFGCYDPTDKTTCQTVRSADADGGRYTLLLFPDKSTAACYRPDGVDYRLCGSGVIDKVWGEIVANDSFILAPVGDSRCSSFGDDLSEDYLACEAALPIKS